MTWAKPIAALFRMDDAAWARHANPWSVWTRIAALPLLVLALWSRAWLGWWVLALVFAVLVWLWVSPRAFPPPRSRTNWASKGVLGERIWLDRDRVPIPAHHRIAANVLSAVAALGLPFLVWGAWALAIWPTLLGLALVSLGKLWFVDRMVWLYEDMAKARPADR